MSLARVCTSIESIVSSVSYKWASAVTDPRDSSLSQWLIDIIPKPSIPWNKPKEELVLLFVLQNSLWDEARLAWSHFLTQLFPTPALLPLFHPMSISVINHSNKHTYFKLCCSVGIWDTFDVLMPLEKMYSTQSAKCKPYQKDLSNRLTHHICLFNNIIHLHSLLSSISLCPRFHVGDTVWHKSVSIPVIRHYQAYHVDPQ